MKTTNTIALFVMTTPLLCTGVAFAELTGNAGVTSNYIFRGVTQSNDAAAGQGGIDVVSGGAYLGIWNSGLAGGDYETDIYGGYKFDVGPATLDVGAIAYLYPLKTPGFDDGVYEGYVGVSAGSFAAKISYSPDIVLDQSLEDDAGLYAEASYTMAVGDKASLILHAGNYSGDGAETVFGSSYSDFSVALAKDEFTFGVSKTSGLKEGSGINGSDPDGTRVFVTYKKSLAL